MTIVTGVPNTLNQPKTYHLFNYLRTGGGLVPVPLTIALIGTMRSTGTATAGVVYDADDPVTTDALFGVQSELALMCREAFACSRQFGRGPRVKAVAVVEPGGGTADIHTLTVVGTATTDGNQIVRVAGRTFLVGVASGAVQNAIAAAIANTLNAKLESLPVLVTVATNVVTLTYPHKGVNGKDIAVSVDQQVAGVVVTAAHSVLGVGVADHQPALDALSPLRYEGIAFANHAAADVTEILSDIAVRWSAGSKTWGWYFIGEPGTIGTATALAAAANHRSVVVANMEGCLSTPGEIATATAMLVFSRERANAGYNGAKVPLYPPGAATLYTAPEVETAIAAGLTVYTGVLDSAHNLTTNLARCERMVTTKTTTGGQPDDINRDIAVSRTGVSIAIQLDIAYEQALGADANPDGIGVEESIPLIKDIIAAILRAEARAKVIKQKFVEDDVSSVVAEPDLVTLGRVNALIPYHVNLPLAQVANVHNVQVGG